MKSYVFSGQGSQFTGMGKDLYDRSELAKKLFEEANEILGYRITDIMFSGTEDDLRQTNITQPAIFLHSVILSRCMGNLFIPDMVAGHSLGEFSALTAAKALNFEDGLNLVYQRAMAMQEACEKTKGTMAAVIGLEADIIDKTLSEITNDIAIAANYNSLEQIVISGSISGIEKASELLKAAGAKRVIPLKVGGAFHSPLMEPARTKLAAAIEQTIFNEPICPIYQNVNAKRCSKPDEIKENLIAQLASPVKWLQSVQNMINDGATEFIEIGPGNVLQGLIKKINGNIIAEKADF